MVLVAIDVELGGHFATQLRLGQHALDRFFDNLFGPACEQAREGLLAEAAGKTGIAAVDLALALEAGEPDFAGVDDDDVIAHIEERRVLRIPLAAQHAGRFGCESAQRFAAGVDDEPFPADLERAWNICRHRYSLSQA